MLVLFLVSTAYAVVEIHSGKQGVHGTLGTASKIWDTLFVQTVSVDGVSGGVPIIVSIGTTATTVATTTRTDITGTSVVLPASFFDSQERYEWTVAGDITGTNGIKQFELYVLNSQVVTTAVGAGDSGAFNFTCFLTASGTSTQIGECGIIVNGSTTASSTIVALTKDLSSGGTIKLQIINVSASDTVSVSTTMITFKK